MNAENLKKASQKVRQTFGESLQPRHAGRDQNIVVGDNGSFREFKEWRMSPRDSCGRPHSHRARRVSYVKDCGEGIVHRVSKKPCGCSPVCVGGKLQRLNSRDAARVEREVLGLTF